ncbi:MAG: nucleotidyltransferase domain-containing protein [Nitrospirae bacterium]|uniref:nucleotidyltransferase domain-containing protein n=1 Tax=Candidatus Magnetobacterium casense TaxID=1455061 RepID=UPI00058BCC04|nr:nucleotidyltransferase domain-containing protein [Candidatus Magnetobacterium casensis]MBF0338901.1 nucleotidyltransferase domain-containing protein [Nitrospirota bacterium]
MDEPLEKAIQIIIQVADPDKIILFGSRSRGDFKNESDYDIFILRKEVTNRRELTQAIYKSLYGIGAGVDLIVESPERFNELKDNPYMIYKEIAKSGKIVYERQ